MDYEKYLREDRFPVIWCAGCGHGTATKALLRAIDKIGLDNWSTFQSMVERQLGLVW